MTGWEELAAQTAEVDRLVTGLADDTATNARLAEGLTLLVEHSTVVHTAMFGALAALEARVEQQRQRIDSLQVDQFAMAERVRSAALAADRAAVGLDEIEEMVTELDERSGQTVADFDAVLRLRDTADPTPFPVRGVDGHQPDALDDEHQEHDAPELPTLELLYGWVAEHIAPLVRRVTATGEGGGIRWCRRWWWHHDALVRFTALYLVYAELSREDTNSWLSAYLRDHVDPHLAVLTSPQGPFYLCSPQRHADTSTALGQAALDSDESETSAEFAPTPPGGRNDR